MLPANRAGTVNGEGGRGKSTLVGVQLCASMAAVEPELAARKRRAAGVRAAGNGDPLDVGRRAGGGAPQARSDAGVQAGAGRGGHRGRRSPADRRYRRSVSRGGRGRTRAALGTGAAASAGIRPRPAGSPIRGAGCAPTRRNMARGCWSSIRSRRPMRARRTIADSCGSSWRRGMPGRGRCGVRWRSSRIRRRAGARATIRSSRVQPTGSTHPDGLGAWGCRNWGDKPGEGRERRADRGAASRQHQGELRARQ